MMDKESLLQMMNRTKILRPPRHTLATFGTTTLRYVLLSLVPSEPGCCRLREGEVTAQRPKILTPEFWKNRFQGFEVEDESIREEFEKVYEDSLKGLEYSFHNDLKTTTLEHASLLEVADRTQKVMQQEGAVRTALLEGPDTHWSLSVLKFVVDTSLRSFPTNLQELDDRGLFNPEKKRETRDRFEIEKLFSLAQTDRQQISKLGDVLKQTGFFADYEDRFFALVKS